MVSANQMRRSCRSICGLSLSRVRVYMGLGSGGIFEQFLEGLYKWSFGPVHSLIGNWCGEETGQVELSRSDFA